MPAAQVALLERADCSGVPRFQTPYFHTNILHLPLTKVVPGTTYRLLATTNLADWQSIQTNTPPADPAIFTDPLATNYPYRYSRLLTP